MPRQILVKRMRSLAAFNKRNDVIILIMQRVHTDDLAAHILEKEDWTHLNLPAIAETRESHDLGDGMIFVREPGDVLHKEREPLYVLEQVKANLGAFYFSSQYQQTPVPECGNIIKWDWFQTYEDLPPLRSADDEVVQSWDTAMKAHDGSDWSACSTWAVRGEDYYLIDMFRDRLDFPTLKRKVEELRQEFSATSVLIEDKGSGTGLIQQLKSEDKVRPIAIQPNGSKADRMAAQSVQIEAGRVFLPRKADWIDEFRIEMLGFPHGSYDDQVDSVSQFLNWIADRDRRMLRVIRVTGF
jgi:predicted phage terminase large subunit-like protein